MQLRFQGLNWLNKLSETELKEHLRDQLYPPQMTAYFGEEEHESFRELLDNAPNFTELGDFL